VSCENKHLVGEAGLSLRGAGEDITLTLRGADLVEDSPTIESMLKASLGLLPAEAEALAVLAETEVEDAAAEELLLTKGLVGAMGSMLNVCRPQVTIW